MSVDKIRKKLRLQEDQKKLILNAPEQFGQVLEGLQHDQTYHPFNAGTYDYVQIFAENQVHLEELALQVGEAGKYDCLFWACYPKGTSKRYKSDIKRDTVWNAFQLIGQRAVTQVAIDEDWSALRSRPYAAVGK